MYGAGNTCMNDDSNSNMSFPDQSNQDYSQDSTEADPDMRMGKFTIFNLYFFFFFKSLLLTSHFVCLM